MLIQQIEQTWQHLNLHLSLANAHMVDYFSKEAFITHIPRDIQQEVNKYGYCNTIEAIFEQQTEQLPNLTTFIKKSQSLTLKNTKFCLSFEQFKQKLEEMGSDEMTKLKLEIFMKPKKSHEVEVLSGAISAIHKLVKTTHLVDIGDGKGYLSSMLALNYKIPVLGVDASPVNTEGAVIRANKLSKVWNSVVSNVKTQETSVDLYKQVTKFVNDQVDFKELITHIFLQHPQKIGVIGLHTCGNLAADCLKIFTANEDIKSIINVSCCYHHLSDLSVDKQNERFPMSQYLKEQNCIVERGARMISAQSIERILHLRERPSKTIFYRAIFEMILLNFVGQVENKQVGRFRKETVDFLDYTKKAAKRLDLSLSMSEQSIMDHYIQYEGRKDEMDVFYLIRAMLAPVVESLILLDRLLYLYECGHNNSFIVQFFDPVVSPRCYGIVSIKA